MNLKNFTKRAPITKSFQLELVPVGNTRNTIRQMKHLEQDEDFRLLLTAATPIIDDCIKDIANKALDALGKEADFSKLDSTGVDEPVKNAETIKKNIMQMLAKKVSESLPKGLKNTADLISANFVKTVLPEYAKKDTMKKVLVQQLAGRSSLMEQFMTTRITLLDTWMPKRVFENFDIYTENAEKLKTILDSEIGKKIREKYAEVDSFTMPAYYGMCLTQNAIDGYNGIISGIATEDGKDSEQGINAIVNEYNQYIRSHKDVKALPKLKKLWKQILMPVEKAFTIEVLENDDDVRNIIRQIINEASPYITTLYDSLSNTGAENIAVYGTQLHYLSHLVFGEHQKITDKIFDVMDAELAEKENISDAKEKKAIQKERAKLDQTILRMVFRMDTIESMLEENVYNVYRKALEADMALLKNAEKSVKMVIESGESIKGVRSNVNAVKEYFNCWTQLRNDLRLIKRNSEEDIDNAFYDVYDKVAETFRLTYKGENLVRNYITKSVGSDLRYEQASFGSSLRPKARWWTPGEKFSVMMQTIIRKDGHFYYFILPAGARPVNLANEDGDCDAFQMRKMQTASMILPRLLFKTAGEFFTKNTDAKEFEISDHMAVPVYVTRDAYDAYKNGTYKIEKLKKKEISEEEFRKALNMILSIYKDFLENNEIYAKMQFALKDVEEYANAGEFCSQVDRHKVSMEWAHISSQAVRDLVNEGNGLLFEITNRNLTNYYKYGNKDLLHGYEGILFTALSDENMADPTLLINSRPKLVYRNRLGHDPESVHKTGSILVNKYDANGNHIPSDIYEQLFRYYNDNMGDMELDSRAKTYIDNKLVVTRKAKEDIIKDARFYREQFCIKLSCKKNMECPETLNTLNAEVMEHYKNSNRVVVIRNTQDLLYYIVQDAQGHVLEQKSLNVIGGINYKARLKEEVELKASEKSEWDYSRKTENIKSGYISKAVSEIARLVIKYNAILVIEKINQNVKDKYSAMDDTCFKKFETMLLSRFADLHFRGIPEGEPGSFSNPYQLCSNDPKKILQDGIVFFVPNGYTRNLDPETNFVCDFDTSKIHTKKGKLAFLSKFDNISIHNDILELSFDYDKFPTHNILPKTDWTCRISHGIVLRDNNTGKFLYHEHPVTEIAEILHKAGISTDVNISEALDDKNLSAQDVDMIYKMIILLLQGNVRKYDDGQRDMYVSPVSGKEYDISYLSAINLSRKCGYYRETATKRGEWFDYIFTLLQ